jgi:hypothetical protein
MHDDQRAQCHSQSTNEQATAISSHHTIQKICQKGKVMCVTNDLRHQANVKAGDTRTCFEEKFGLSRLEDRNLQ